MLAFLPSSAFRARTAFSFSNVSISRRYFLICVSKDYEICSDSCRKVQAIEAKKQYDERTKEDKPEQYYESAYNYWSNRIRKLKRHKATPDQIQAAQKAFGEFRKEALRRKSDVKRGIMALPEFSSWLLKQQQVIDLLMT